MSKAGGSFKMCFTAISDLQRDCGAHARGDQLLKALQYHLNNCVRMYISSLLMYKQTLTQCLMVSQKISRVSMQIIQSMCLFRKRQFQFEKAW